MGGWEGLQLFEKPILNSFFFAYTHFTCSLLVSCGIVVSSLKNRYL